MTAKINKKCYFTSEYYDVQTQILNKKKPRKLRGERFNWLGNQSNYVLLKIKTDITHFKNKQISFCIV